MHIFHKWEVVRYFEDEFFEQIIGYECKICKQRKVGWEFPDMPTAKLKNQALAWSKATPKEQ